MINPQRILRGPLMSLACAAAVLLWAAAWAGVSAQQRRPLDPLTDEERRQAASIADLSASAKSLRGTGRQRLVAVELVDVKPDDAASVTVEDPARPVQRGRHAEVLYYRYDTNDGVRVLVDLERREVRDAMRVSGDAVPLSFEEIQEAATLAVRDTRVRSLLGPSAERFRAERPSSSGEQRRGDDDLRVEGLRIRATSPRDPCWRRRCVSLLFRRGRYYVVGTEVTVELSGKTVMVERKRR